MVSRTIRGDGRLWGEMITTGIMGGSEGGEANDLGNVAGSEECVGVDIFSLIFFSIFA